MAFVSIAVLLVLAVIAVLVGIALNTLWMRAGTTKPAGASLPSCGKCGYPVRGVSTLNCPECGADLREAGIVMPRQHRATPAGCLLPVVFTVVVMILAGALMPWLEGMLPTYEHSRYEIRLSPQSGQYAHTSLAIEMSEATPQGSSNVFSNSGMSSSSSWSSSGQSKTTISLSGPNSQATVHSISFAAAPNTSNTTAWRNMCFEVDPGSRQAWWTTPQGVKRQSQRPFSDQDVLAFLADAGADTSRPEVVNEAKEIHAVMDGLSQGMTNFTLTAFTSGGSSSWGSSIQSPGWFSPAYRLGWLAIWIVGLIVIVRWGRRKRGERLSEQTTNKI